MEGTLFTVVEFLHVKPGKGAAFVRTKLKNLDTGAVLERNVSGANGCSGRTSRRKKCSTFTRRATSTSLWTRRVTSKCPSARMFLDDAMVFIKDGMTIMVQFYQGRAIGVDLPSAVELKVVQTDPGVRGDTVSGEANPPRWRRAWSSKCPCS